MYCSSLNRISKLSAYCSILYLSDFFYYNICTLRYLNIIYTMNYFSCIWRSPGHFTDSKCWRFSWLFIFVEIVDLNFNIQLNYTYCQEERCFTIHATPLTNLKYNSLNLRSIYWTAINHIYYCHYLSENETLKKNLFYLEKSELIGNTKKSSIIRLSYYPLRIQRGYLLYTPMLRVFFRDKRVLFWNARDMWTCMVHRDLGR